LDLGSHAEVGELHRALLRRQDVRLRNATGYEPFEGSTFLQTARGTFPSSSECSPAGRMCVWSHNTVKMFAWSHNLRILKYTR